jgi:hypothetical protein
MKGLKDIDIRDIPKVNKEFKVSDTFKFEVTEQELQVAENWWNLLTDHSKVAIHELITSEEGM